MLRRDLIGTLTLDDEPIFPEGEERVELWKVVSGEWKLMGRCYPRDARRIGRIIGGDWELRPLRVRRL